MLTKNHFQKKIKKRKREEEITKLIKCKHNINYYHLEKNK